MHELECAGIADDALLRKIDSLYTNNTLPFVAEREHPFERP
jgi:hypothetical protein